MKYNQAMQTTLAAYAFSVDVAGCYIDQGEHHEYRFRSDLAQFHFMNQLVIDKQIERLPIMTAPYCK